MGYTELDDALDFLRWRLFAALARSNFLKLSSNHRAKIVNSQLSWLQSQYRPMKLGGGRYEYQVTSPVSIG